MMMVIMVITVICFPLPLLHQFSHTTRLSCDRGGEACSIRAQILFLTLAQVNRLGFVRPSERCSSDDQTLGCPVGERQTITTLRFFFLEVVEYGCHDAVCPQEKPKLLSYLVVNLGSFFP